MFVLVMLLLLLLVGGVVVVVSAAIPFAHFTLSSAADVSATFMNLQKK
jgi:uncharacterized protein involved in propanediol utilization